jgi:hypothetical protein
MGFALCASGVFLAGCWPGGAGWPDCHRFDQRMKSDKFVLLGHGTVEESAQVDRLLETYREPILL